MICEGVVHGPLTYVLNHEGPCTLKSTWMMVLQFEGSKDEVIIHCCTNHKQRSQANEERIIAALSDFGITATIRYRGIQ